MNRKEKLSDQHTYQEMLNHYQEMADNENMYQKMLNNYKKTD